jgi:hypothetical protein
VAGDRGQLLLQGRLARFQVLQALLQAGGAVALDQRLDQLVELARELGQLALLARAGGSLVPRTAGEVSARCHDEQANFLAPNLMHDIVTGAKGVQEARNYYAKEFADSRRKKPTPYMEGLRFRPGDHSAAADPDVRTLSDQDLEQAAEEERKSGS